MTEYVLAQPVLFTHTIQVRGRKARVPCETGGRRQPRQSREANVAARAARLSLRPPRPSDRELPAVTVNVVEVREITPPDNDERVVWQLLTSLPVEDIEQVRQVIQCYCVRSMIEVLFRGVKSGCRVEARRCKHINRLLSCLAGYLIVAWRTLYVCRLGRSCPDMACQAVFEPAEWKAVWQVIRGTAPPASHRPWVRWSDWSHNWDTMGNEDAAARPARKRFGSVCSGRTASRSAGGASAPTPEPNRNWCRTTSRGRAGPFPVRSQIAGGA